jgi:hypothetical protein
MASQSVAKERESGPMLEEWTSSAVENGPNDLLAPFGWNYKPAEKHCWLIFCERKILFRLKKQTE